MYTITIRLPGKRIGVLTKIRTTLKSAYQSSNTTKRCSIKEDEITAGIIFTVAEE